MSSRENSVTGLIAQYLRQQGVSTNTFESLEIPGQGVKEPDFAVHESGHFYGEAKWEDGSKSSRLRDIMPEMRQPVCHIV